MADLQPSKSVPEVSSVRGSARKRKEVETTPAVLEQEEVEDGEEESLSNRVKKKAYDFDEEDDEQVRGRKNVEKTEGVIF